MITLTAFRGVQFIVDEKDAEAVAKLRWHIASTGYPATTAKRGAGGRSMLLHRLLMGDPPEAGMEIDHVDGNKLNNARANLRWCTHAQNMLNKPVYSNSVTGVKGVSLHKATGKWVARIKDGQKYRHLGLFIEMPAAAAAYRAAAERAHGAFSRRGTE